jgi:hypothetical protein
MILAYKLLISTPYPWSVNTIHQIGMGGTEPESSNPKDHKLISTRSNLIDSYNQFKPVANDSTCAVFRTTQLTSFIQALSRRLFAEN